VNRNREVGAVIRKHNRRAAKAAFAIALGVAIVLGGAAAAPAGVDRGQATPIIIGTKDFPEQYVLGQLYKQALEAKGFKVQYKENIGSTELIDKSLRSGKVTFYPEYTGIMLSVTFGKKTLPKTALGTYNLAKQLYGKRGQTLLKQTPFQDRDAIAVLRTTATKYGVKTVGDLKKIPDLTLAGFPQFETRWAPSLKKNYGVSFDFTPLAGTSAYTLLSQKKVLAAAIFSTDPQLISTKYVVLSEPRNLFGFQYVAPVLDKDLLSENGSSFSSTVNKVSALLTTRAMIAMNKAVAIDKKPAASVAKAFLKANKLS
jgi:osmoprotectant transport system substrate-binding protein